MLKANLEDKMEMAEKQSQYQNKLINQCNSCCGPVCTIKALQSAMKKRPDTAEITG